MSRLDFLAGEHDRVRAGIEQIEANPAGDGGDLSDEQKAQSAVLFARAVEIGTELEPIIERHRSLDATANILASLGMARSANGMPAIQHGPGPGVTDVTPGEYFASYARAIHPDSGSRAALQEHVERFRTVATMTTADTPSILPKPILGPVINFIDSTRYVVPTFTQRPMPDKGKQFSRPRVTQHVTVGVQAAELDELSSQKMVLAGEDVSKRTIGGSLQVSQQDLDWTDPSALDLVFADFTDTYAKVTDAAAAASLVAACPAGSIAWVATSVGTILSSFATAATSIYTASSFMPTDAWVSLDVGLALGSLTTTTGDLVFPNIGSGVLNITDPGLGIDGPLGLRLHVCPNFAANTRIIGNRTFAEWFEQRNGFLQVTFPSALKVELAYYGYIASYFRSEGFVRLFG